MNYLQALEKHLVTARNHTAGSRTLFPEVRVVKKGRKINKFNKQLIGLTSVKAESFYIIPFTFQSSQMPKGHQLNHLIHIYHQCTWKTLEYSQSYNPKCIPLPAIRVPFTPLSGHAECLSEIDINFLYPPAKSVNISQILTDFSLKWWHQGRVFLYIPNFPSYIKSFKTPRYFSSITHLHFGKWY